MTALEKLEAELIPAIAAAADEAALETVRVAALGKSGDSDTTRISARQFIGSLP